MTRSNNVIHLDSTFPLWPMYSIEAMTGRCLEIPSPQVVPCEIKPVPVVEQPNDFVSFLDFGQSKIQLSIAKFAVNSFLVIWGCIPWVICVLSARSRRLSEVQAPDPLGKCSPDHGQPYGSESNHAFTYLHIIS